MPAPTRACGVTRRRAVAWAALAAVATGGLAGWLATVLTASELPSESSPPGADAQALSRLAPRGLYVVVDTARNRLSLRRRDEILYTAVASTGSGARLIDPRDPSRGWRFDTPRGVFSITSKHVNPVWIRPDWAFLEEGLLVPSTPEERVEPGVLGHHALGFGNGYFIHGTLYTRLLGTNVTHGCIRLGDADLEHIFKTVPLGATVLIY